MIDYAGLPRLNADNLDPTWPQPWRDDAYTSSASGKSFEALDKRHRLTAIVNEIVGQMVTVSRYNTNSDEGLHVSSTVAKAQGHVDGIVQGVVLSPEEEGMLDGMLDGHIERTWNERVNRAARLGKYVAEYPLYAGVITPGTEHEITIAGVTVKGESLSLGRIVDFSARRDGEAMAVSPLIEGIDGRVGYLPNLPVATAVFQEETR